MVIMEHAMARGLLFDSDLQATLWREGFSKIKKFDSSQSCLSLALAPILPDIVQQRLGEMIFEDFGFDAYC